MPALHIPEEAWKLASVDAAELSRGARAVHQLRVGSFVAGLWLTMAACVGVAIGAVVGTVLLVAKWGSLVVGPGEIPMGGAGSVTAGALMSYVLVVALPVLAVGCGFMARRTWFVWKVWQSGQIRAWEHEALGHRQSSLRQRGVWVWTQAVLAGGLVAGSAIGLVVVPFVRGWEGVGALLVASLLFLVLSPFWLLKSLNELLDWRRARGLLDRESEL